MAMKLNILLILLVVIKLKFAHATEIHSTKLTENFQKNLPTTNLLNKRTSHNNINTIKTLNNINKILKKTSILEQDVNEENLNLNMWVDFFKVHRGIQFKNVNLVSSVQSFSVVQDWNSVCSQLCGAGLGGAGCHHGPHPDLCDKIKEDNSQNEDITLKAKKLLKNNDNVICKDLCKYQLGGDICGCEHNFLSMSKSMIIDEIDQNQLSIDRNRICCTFCENNQITLAGCSICTKTPTTQITPATTTTTKKPDWNQICVELCKTGDGGSLCNCDKPPLF